MKRRVDSASRLKTLAPGEIVVVSLGRDAMGIPAAALVGRTAAGALYAYRNLCKHLPIPLDGGSGEFQGANVGTGEPTLRCGTHGALYRVSDGQCVRGPCRGTRLERYWLSVDEAGDVWVSDAPLGADLPPLDRSDPLDG